MTPERRGRDAYYLVPVLELLLELPPLGGVALGVEVLGLEAEPETLPEPDVVPDVEDELSVVVLLDEPLVDGVVDVEGDAAGVRSVPGRSPTRSVRDSVHPATVVTPSARAKSPVSILFITPASLSVVREPSLPCCNHRARSPPT